MSGRPGRSQEDVRRHNLSAILTEVHVRGATSRARLTEVTGLNRSTIGVLTSELDAVGLVAEDTPVASGAAGRPSIQVRPSGEVYVVALDIGVDHLAAARVGLGGVVQARKEITQARTNPSVATVLGRLERLVDHVLAETPKGSRCVGVGVSLCGIVRRADGFVRLSPNLNWVDVPLGSMISERLGLGVSLELGNDADLGALAEVTRGVARGRRDVIYLAGEVGLGGGLVVDGRPLAGSGGYAGEVGHMTVNPRGRRCRCGSRGCWETEVGEDALLDGFDDVIGRGRAPAVEVVRAAAAGDRRARRVVDRVGTWLGTGIGNLVNTFNPEMVVLGGLLIDVYPVAREQVHEALDRVALRAPGESVHVSVSGLGQDSPLIGAAELAFQPLLADPLRGVETRAS